MAILQNRKCSFKQSLRLDRRVRFWSALLAVLLSLAPIRNSAHGDDLRMCMVVSGWGDFSQCGWTPGNGAAACSGLASGGGAGAVSRLDDSDQRAGGCGLTWQVEATVPSQYVIDLCVNHTGTGGAQCPNPGVRCTGATNAPSFISPQIGDDTDSRGGYCTTQFLLREYNPNTQFVFRMCWRTIATGDSSQCGGADRSGCTGWTENPSWSPAIFDDTDNRGGGCAQYYYVERKQRANYRLPACRDGIDNDGDGAADLSDPSCTGNPDKDDEVNPKSQCQDGVDNDADGAVDYPADFGCSSLTDLDESNPKAQCFDGVDNDGDGAADFPYDFSCSSTQDNDETNPRAHCQDGLDNDGDGLVDLQDPGCKGNTQRNDETNQAAPQCSDGLDNDGDGAVDGADFGCSSPGDNDEGDPKADCDDGIDNDHDGLVDLNDPGCDGRQDNDESNSPPHVPTPECSDGIDNDGDGAIDTDDFSCTSSTKDDETNPKAQCQDGRDNDGDGEIDLKDPGCQDSQDDNERNKIKPVIKPQCSDGIDNDGDGAVDLSDFSCGGDSAKNDELLPRTQCQDGLDNDNDNFVDQEDPDCVSSQDNNEQGPAPACVDEVAVTVAESLDDIALRLATIANESADQLLRDAGRVSGRQAQAQRDVVRTKRFSLQYLNEARTLTLKVPTTTRTCPNLPPVCRESDNAGTIASLKANQQRSANLVARTLNRSGFRVASNTRRYSTLIKNARTLAREGNAALAQLPPIAQSCTN